MTRFAKSGYRHSELVRLRVLLQFDAIVVIMATVWAMGAVGLNQSGFIGF